MDEVVEQALSGLRTEVGQVRHDISVLSDDFKAHARQDTRDIGELKAQIDNWTGQAKIIGWLVAAILTAVVAGVARHW